MKLYPDQLNVVKDFKHWLFETNEPIAGLWAPAGYGKTYSVNSLLKVLEGTDYPVVLTSMTNVAAGILSAMSGKDATTLHKGVGWHLEENDTTGGTDLVCGKKPKIAFGSFLLVDEAGMIAPEVLKALKALCKEMEIRVLVVGDHKQVFPVMKEGQRLCVPAYEAKMPKFTLTTPKRQAEGDILFALCERLRAAVDGARMPKMRTIDQGNGKGVFEAEDFKEEIVIAFRDAKLNGRLDQVKVLAYTNRAVIKLNQLIRKEVYGNASFRPRDGEELVANTTIKQYDNDAAGDVIIIAKD